MEVLDERAVALRAAHDPSPGPREAALRRRQRDSEGVRHLDQLEALHEAQDERRAIVAAQAIQDAV